MWITKHFNKNTVYNKGMPRIHEYTCTELREKYPSLLQKFQEEMRKTAEMERTCMQQGEQLEHQNEMIANLLKERREKNWLYQQSV